MRLDNKIALVTGAARGLGRGIAMALAEYGATVFVNDVSASDDTGQLVASIKAAGGEAAFIAADVTDEEAVRDMYSKIVDQAGRLDILVNNVGTDRPADIWHTSLEDWNFILKTNLTSCFLCSKYAMEAMKTNRGGSIVNVSSVVGHQGALKGHVHYAATKSGMLGFTKTLARTAAPFGIRVNAVAPGVIETELSRNTHGAEGMKQLSSNIPLGLGTVRDVGLAVVFLCGEGSRYMTGATLDVNGGLYLR